MYYELIKMLISHERQEESSGGEMAARLQRYLNQRFLSDLDSLKKKSKVSSIQAGETDMKTLVSRLEYLEEKQMKLEKSNKELKETNRIIMEKFSSAVKSNSQPEKQVNKGKQLTGI